MCINHTSHLLLPAFLVVTGLKDKPKKTFGMTDLGLLHFFLDILVMQLDNGIFISKPKYALVPLIDSRWKIVGLFLLRFSRV